MLDRKYMHSVVTATLTQMTKFLIVYKQQWLPCGLKMCVPLSCLCDLNGHDEEWLGSTTTNRQACQATVSGCNQLVVGPTHARLITSPIDD